MFQNADPTGKPIYVMFKSGDDLRQDMLTLQMIKLMNRVHSVSWRFFSLISYIVLAGRRTGLGNVSLRLCIYRYYQTCFVCFVAYCFNLLVPVAILLLMNLCVGDEIGMIEIVLHSKTVAAISKVFFFPLPRRSFKCL